MSSRKPYRLLILSAALALSVSGQATANEEANPTGEIGKTQTNTALIQAKIAEMKAQKELDALQRSLVVESESLKKVEASAVRSEHPTEPPPQVLAIFGTGKSLYASLMYPNGLRQDVRTGDEIEGGFRVASITPSRVRLSRSGIEYTLRIFAGMAAPEKAPVSAQVRR